MLHEDVCPQPCAQRGPAVAHTEKTQLRPCEQEELRSAHVAPVAASSISRHYHVGGGGGKCGRTEGPWQLNPGPPSTVTTLARAWPSPAVLPALTTASSVPESLVARAPARPGRPGKLDLGSEARQPRCQTAQVDGAGSRPHGARGHRGPRAHAESPASRGRRARR